MNLKKIIKETINNFIYNQTSLINEYLDKEQYRKYLYYNNNKLKTNK